MSNTPPLSVRPTQPSLRRDAGQPTSTAKPSESAGFAKQVDQALDAAGTKAGLAGSASPKPVSVQTPARAVEAPGKQDAAKADAAKPGEETPAAQAAPSPRTDGSESRREEVASETPVEGDEAAKEMADGPPGQTAADFALAQPPSEARPMDAAEAALANGGPGIAAGNAAEQAPATASEAVADESGGATSVGNAEGRQAPAQDSLSSMRNEPATTEAGAAKDAKRQEPENEIKNGEADASAFDASALQAAASKSPDPAPVPGVAAAHHAPAPAHADAPAAAQAPAAPQPAPTPTPTPTPPATQLGAAFVQLSAPKDASGIQRMVIRLDPLELGHVQIRIDRTPGGPARVELAIERTDTLMTLLQDRPRLEKALDQAGVPSEGRTIQFSLAAAESGGGSGRQAGFAGSGGGSGGHNAWGGHSRGGRDGAGLADLDGAPARSGWLRAGIDITA